MTAQFQDSRQERGEHGARKAIAPQNDASRDHGCLCTYSMLVIAAALSNRCRGYSVATSTRKIARESIVL